MFRCKIEPNNSPTHTLAPSQPDAVATSTPQHPDRPLNSPFGMGLGGGNDGGVIAAKRRFLVKVKKADARRDAAEDAVVKWMTCACSGEPLSEPVSASQAQQVSRHLRIGPGHTCCSGRRRQAGEPHEQDEGAPGPQGQISPTTPVPHSKLQKGGRVCMTAACWRFTNETLPCPAGFDDPEAQLEQEICVPAVRQCS